MSTRCQVFRREFAISNRVGEKERTTCKVEDDTSAKPETAARARRGTLSERARFGGGASCWQKP